MPVTLTCVVCMAEFSVQPCRKRTAKYCSYTCHQVGEGRKGGATRSAQMKAASTGKAYGKTNGRHTHRGVAEQRLGRALRRGEIVHHVDGNIHNNDPDNLAVITQSEHVRLHVRDMLQKRFDKHGY